MENHSERALPEEKPGGQVEKLAAERKILRSDLDANGHLYSARYADIVLVTSNQHFLYGDAIFSRVSQLAVVDMIYTGVLLSDYDRYTKILDRSSKIISKQAYRSQDTA